MNKTNVILICIIIALVSGILGFVIGKNMTKASPSVTENMTYQKELAPEEKCIGTYYTSTWNGREATLVLNADMTMKYPTGITGTWTVEGDKVHLYLNVQELGIKEEYVLNTIDTEYIATIVNNGLILNDCFFQKMN